jgi:hypothetical protein
VEVAEAEEPVREPELAALAVLAELTFGEQQEMEAQVVHLTQQEQQEAQELATETEAVAVVELEQLQEPQASVELEQLERSSFIGNPPTPEDLPYKMYAAISNGIVIGYTWEKSNPELDYVLMTYENTPAWVNGRYEKGKFYKPEGEINA